MGILQAIIEIFRDGKISPPPGPQVDDQQGVTDAMLQYLFKDSFANVKIGDIQKGIERAYPSADGKQILDDLGALPLYTKSKQIELKQLLTAILAKISTNIPAPKVKDLKHLRPGGSINGGTTGTIGGFLINTRKEIFLFGDAHVLAKNLITPVSRLKQPSDRRDKITKNGVEIGEVVCSSEIRIGGNMNYDIALAAIDPAHYHRISLQYSASTKNQSSGQKFHVTKVDRNLFDGKKVYLFGHISGYSEGKLKTSKPADVNQAPYDKFINSSAKQNITVHDCIIVESANGQTVTREGDSGGLWVNDDGEAVGIQVMVGHETNVAWIHPMSLVMDYFWANYDASLRFVTSNDLPKPSCS